MAIEKTGAWRDLGNWREWLNPRRAQCWLLIVVVLYSLLGFVIVPWQLKERLPALSADFLKRTATVTDVSFNPWSLRLEARGLLLSDTDNTPLLTVETLAANLQLRSLFRLALVFVDIELEQPRIYVTRYRFGESNLGNLVMEFGEPTEDDSAAKDDGELFRLVIDALAIRDGALTFTDQMPAEPFTTELGPIDIGLTNLSTLPEDSGNQEVSIHTETGARLSWTGELTVNPLLSTGKLTVSGSPLPLLSRYLGDQLNFTLENCCLDVALEYRVAATPDGGIEAAVRNLNASLRELSLFERDSDTPFFALPELRIDGGEVDWPAGVARVEAVSIDSPRLTARLLEDGSLDLQKLLAPANPASGPAAPADDTGTETAAADSMAWDLSLGRFDLSGMQFGFTDTGIAAPNELRLTGITLGVDELSNRDGARSPLSLSAALTSGGTITVTGDLAIAREPGIRLDATLDNIGLAVLQPWVQESALVAIDEGQLNVKTSLATSAAETLTARGSLSIDGLAVRDTSSDTPLIGWQSLRFNDLRLDLDATELEVSRIELQEPFARLLIDETGATNFQSLVKDGGDAAEPAAESAPAASDTGASTPFRVQIGETAVSDGMLDFSDLALPLPFRALISEFGGEISAFASDSARASDLDFEGKVGDYGYSTITGSLNLLDPTAQANVTAIFRNVSMPDLSPYTVEFVGQKIESGKLDLDLQYAFDQRVVRGANTMVLTQFELGDKVDNPEAMDLPLGLAVGLLRDVNGVINLNLNVSGNLDDPSFSASGLILKAFANLITKAVAAPFKLLGGLVPGLGEEDSNVVFFPAGSASLTPPEREKLDLIATALAQRPALVLDVAGGTEATIDIPGLQAAAAEALLDEALGETPGEGEQLLRRKVRALEKLVRRAGADGDISLKDLEQQFVKADGSGELDEVAYVAELEQRLAASQPVGEDQLQQLAVAREQAIVTMLAATELAAERVRTGSTAKVSGDDGRVAIELGLEAP